MTASTTSRSITVAAACAVLAGAAACSSPAHPAASSTSSPISVPTTVTAAPTPTPSTSAPAGSITSGDKSFSVVAPTGWKKFGAKGATLAIKAPSPQDKVDTNFTAVVQSPQPVPALDDVVSQAEIAWRQHGVRVTDEPDRTIGGLPAGGYTLTRTAQGTKFTQTQFFVVYRGHVYSLTLTSAATSAASAAANQALDAILSTWAWRQS